MTVPDLSTGDIITEAFVQSLKPTAWTAFTPVWQNLATHDGPSTGRYQYVLDAIRLQGRMDFGSTTSLVGNLGMVLPFGLSSDANSLNTIGTVRIIDSGGGFTGTAFLGDGDSDISFQSDGGAVNASSPMTWTVGDSLRFDIVVPL